MSIRVWSWLLSLALLWGGSFFFAKIAVSELPPTRSRALDFLNAPERFFQLLTDEGTLCLNRRFVRATRPLS